jgi:hypothetical protein
MVVAELDEVTYDLEVDGVEVRRQLERRVWEHAGWATIAIAFQERDGEGEWKAAKVALLRFRRVREAWQRQAAITLRGGDALALVDAIGSWRERIGE